MDKLVDSIWIVAVDEEVKKLCQNSLAENSLRFFSSWEALIAEIISCEECYHPRFCLICDFGTAHTNLWLPLLHDSLRPTTQVVLYGPALDLDGMQSYFSQWGIVDYIGLPLKKSKLQARFEIIQLMSA